MTAILLKVLIEALKAIAGKLLFAAVSERFLSRIACLALRKLADATTNELTRDVVEELIAALKRDDLPELK